MARNATISVSDDDWIELTANDATAVRINVAGGGSVHIMATVGSVKPTDFSGSVLLLENSIVPATDFFAEMFPGVAGANRVWARSTASSFSVSVSHD